MNYKFLNALQQEEDFTNEQIELIYKELNRLVIEPIQTNLLATAKTLLLDRVKSGQVFGTSEDYKDCIKTSMEMANSTLNFSYSDEWVEFIDIRMQEFFDSYEKKFNKSYFEAWKENLEKEKLSEPIQNGPLWNGNGGITN